MINKTIILNDNLNNRNTISVKHANPFFRTQVIAGYDHKIDSLGRDTFGRVIFEEENMTLIGGSIFTLEKLFGVRMSNMSVSHLSDEFRDKGLNGPSVWDSHSTDPLTADNIVCLFGVGTGGAGDSIATINDVKYYQRNISEMIPIRYVDSDSDLSADEHSKYFCRSEGDNKVGYYLKKFDNVTIECKWRDSDNEAEGSNVGDAYYTTDNDVTTPIETYVQVTLKISKDDVREWFEYHGDVERARINTIGLFTGVPKNLDTPIDVELDIATGETYQRTFDYDQVTCFSCLNFDNEMLALPKDLTIVYRIFTK